MMLLKNHLNHSLYLSALPAGRRGSSSPPPAKTGTAECGHDALCSHHYCIKERHFDQQRYGGTKMVRNKRDKHIQMLTVKLPRQPGNINIVSIFFLMQRFAWHISWRQGTTHYRIHIVPNQIIEMMQRFACCVNCRQGTAHLHLPHHCTYTESPIFNMTATTVQKAATMMFETSILHKSIIKIQITCRSELFSSDSSQLNHMQPNYCILISYKDKL